jgi:hypothetical protein
VRELASVIDYGERGPFRRRARRGCLPDQDPLVR